MTVQVREVRGFRGREKIREALRKEHHKPACDPGQKPGRLRLTGLGTAAWAVSTETADMKQVQEAD